ncbi:GGDEF domain-containing protein [Pseudocitrobacter cyperus]|uniref:diguanylate cyclase n=1 Tax=Pseudocitrobacter cyperus TaxID=3112843 RepID=A0ABV0HF81_9ENTR
MKRIQDDLRKKQALLVAAGITGLFIFLYLFFMYQRALNQVNDGITTLESKMLAIFNDNELIADATGVRYQQIKSHGLCGSLNDFRPRNRDEWGINADRSGLNPGFGTLISRSQSSEARCMFAAGEFVRSKMNTLNPGHYDTHRYIVARDAHWFYWFTSKDSAHFSFSSSKMANNPGAFFQIPETFYDRLLLKDSRRKARSSTNFYIDKITGEKAYSLVSYIYDLSDGQVSNNIVGYLLYDFSKPELRRALRDAFNNRVPTELMLKFVNRQDGSHLCLTDNCDWPTVYQVYPLSDRYEFRYALPLYLYILHDPLASTAVLLAPLIFLLLFFFIRRWLDKSDNRFYSDALTGCYTRNILELVQKFDMTYKTVLMFDCNKFKAINDAWGHNAGDRALKIIAQCMLDNVRSPQDLVVRTGGDEFVVLLADASKEDARYLGERITLQIMQQDFRVDGNTVPLSVSWGMASDISELYSAIHQADVDMYRMKKGEAKG